MEKSLRIRILEFLNEKNATDRSINILPILLKNELDTIDNRAIVGLSLRSMESQGLILCPEHEYNPLRVNKGKELDPLPNAVNARLTVDGESYLNNLRLTQSNIDVNNASIRNNKTQNRLSTATIIVAAIGALMAVFSFFKENGNSNDIKALKIQLKELEKERLNIVAESMQIQNPKASQRDLPHTAQPFSVDILQKTYNKNKKAHDKGASVKK